MELCGKYNEEGDRQWAIGDRLKKVFLLPITYSL